MRTPVEHGPRARALGPFAVAAAAILLATPASLRAAGEGSGTRFEAETTVVAVEVPVRVLRDGKPVRGLTADNFAVFDEGEPREVTSFQVLDLEEAVSAPSEQAPAEAPTAARRHFLLLFDLDFTDGPYLQRAHDAARELVDRGLEPTDLVAVAFFSNRAGVSSVLGFTPDRSQVVAALDRLGRFLGKDVGGRRSDDERGADPLGMTEGGWSAVRSDLSAAVERERSLADETLDWAGGTGGRRGSIDETLADMAAFASEDMQQKNGARASALVVALQNLANQYRWVDGQKFLVMFSQSFEADLYTSEGGSWLLREMRDMLDAFRKAGWSIYSIEGVDLNTASAKRRRETLFFLAHETGGEVVAGRNDLSVSMAKVLMQTSVTYVLGFQAPDLPADGSFRRLRVELRGVPRGNRVFSRAGYFVPRPFSELGPEERRAQAAELILAGREENTLDAGVFVGPMELTSSGARVPVVLELPRETLLAGPADGDAGAEIHVYALDPQGKVAGVLAQRVALDPEKLSGQEGDPKDGLKFFGELDLPPGSYDVRALARSLRSGWVTLRRLPIEVPASADQRALLAPLFLQGPAERWLLVRKPREGSDPAQDDYPFTFEGERFLPATHGSVESDGEARLVVMGYGLGADRVDLESRVVDPAGTPIDGPELGYLARAAGDGRHPDQIVLSWRPEGVAPGDYVLELTLREPDGERIGSLRAPVTVVRE